MNQLFAGFFVGIKILQEKIIHIEILGKTVSPKLVGKYKFPLLFIKK